METKTIILLCIATFLIYLIIKDSNLTEKFYTGLADRLNIASTIQSIEKQAAQIAQDKEVHDKETQDEEEQEAQNTTNINETVQKATNNAIKTIKTAGTNGINAIKTNGANIFKNIRNYTLYQSDKSSSSGAIWGLAGAQNRRSIFDIKN